MHAKRAQDAITSVRNHLPSWATRVSGSTLFAFPPCGGEIQLWLLDGLFRDVPMGACKIGVLKEYSSGPCLIVSLEHV